MKITKLRSLSRGLEKIGPISGHYVEQMGRSDRRISTFTNPFSSAIANLNSDGAWGLPLPLGTVAPTFVYEGRNASASGLVASAGSDLALVGSGAEPSYHQDTPLPNYVDEAALFNGGKVFGAAAPLVVGTDDVVFEAVAATDKLGTLEILSTLDGSIGLNLYFNGSSVIWRIDTAVGNAFCFALLPNGPWVHLFGTMDRNGSCILYINGVPGAAVDISAHVAASATGGAITIGANSGPAAPADGVRVAYAAGWVGAGILDTHLQADLVADRFDRLTAYPSKALGGSAATFNRAAVATIRKMVYGQVQRLFSVGPHWPAVEMIRDAQTDKDNDNVVSNGFSSSEDLTASSWNKVACTIESSTGETFRGREVQGIVGTAVDTAHGISTALDPATPHRHIFVGAFKAGAQSAVRLASTDLSSNSVWAQFKLDGSETSASLTGGNILCTGQITPLSDGFYLCCMSYNGGAFNHTHLVLPVADAEVDDATYTGDGSTVDLNVAWLTHDYSDQTTGRIHLLGGDTSGYVKTSGAVRSLGEAVTGYFGEEAATNYAWYSEDLTSWIKTSTIAANDIVAPDGQVTADKVTMNPGQNLYQFTTANTALTPAHVSFWMKTTTTTGTLNIQHTNGTSHGQWTLALSLVSTTALERITSDHPAVTVLTPFRWDGSGVGGFFINRAGTAAVFHLWGLQWTANTVLQSYIKTPSNAAVIRDKTELYYPGDENVRDGANPRTYVCKAVVPAGHSGALWCISDGTATNQVLLTIEPSTGVARVQTAIAVGDTGDVTGTTDLTDGEEHEIRVLLAAGQLRLIVDGTEEGTRDTSVDIPQGLDEWAVGGDESASGGSQPNASVTHLRCDLGLRV